MNVYILLDRSGSMESMWSEALSSINAYVKELTAETNVYMAVFDTDYKVIRNTTAAKWQKVTNDDAVPRGGTRLYDSAVRMMHRVIDDGSKRNVMIVMTDGFENASLNFKHSDVKSLVKTFEDSKWELIFLGANFDRVGEVAGNLGVAVDRTMNITAGNMRDYMGTTLSAATRSYAATGVAMSISEEDKRKATL